MSINKRQQLHVHVKSYSKSIIVNIVGCLNIKQKTYTAGEREKGEGKGERRGGRRRGQGGGEGQHKHEPPFATRNSPPLRSCTVMLVALKNWLLAIQK